jgi:hypothetical protein
MAQRRSDTVRIFTLPPSFFEVVHHDIVALLAKSKFEGRAKSMDLFSLRWKALCLLGLVADVPRVSKARNQVLEGLSFLAHIQFY